MVITQNFSRLEGSRRPISARLPVDDDRTDASCDSGDIAFVIELITVGAHANGFGRNADGRQFTFRVHKSALFVEIYRQDLRERVPGKSDVSAAVEESVTEIDLMDERSIIAAVRDAVTAADESSRASRSLLHRVGSTIGRIVTRQNVTA